MSKSKYIIEVFPLSLNPRKRQGSDLLRAAVIGGIAPQVAKPLTDLFNRFLVLVEVLDNWRSTIGRHIYKKGDLKTQGINDPLGWCQSCANWWKWSWKWPFSITYSRRWHYLGAQHEFIPHCFSLPNLLVAEERITRLVDSYEEVNLVYRDFAKAFDSVNDQILWDNICTLVFPDPL